MNSRRLWAALVAVVVAAMAVGVNPAPAAAVTQLMKLYQEPGDYEARFPDILKLADGRLMAVWHKAKSHQGDPGTVQLSYGTANGTSWSAPVPALAHPSLMAGKDMRDPKLGKMNDGAVVMTFFVPGDGVYSSVWKPGWTRFDDPEKLVVAGIPGSVPAQHASVLALPDQGGSVNQVLIAVYNNTGAWFVRATWRPVTAPRLLAADAFQLAANAPAANGFTHTYTEPSFVQIDGTVVAVVRHELNNGSVSNGAPAKVLKWNPYTFAGPQSYYDVQDLPVQASSHHLLVTQDKKVLFTFGDKAVSLRPTQGILIDSPLAPWPTTGLRKVLIYNSGSGDQANPSSVEVSSGRFLTLAYNAKPKSTVEGGGASPNGGSLWIMQSYASEY
ncbi:exo-alpha-sialidase [Asanoa sp. WMMD1127]|uniref:exo-alpha-sialidase n=1 Tax=Asanoa sp. WMMD1127 TaxID=3016107 RepID=UPI002417BBF4|nr:exo-alpha-sialidase [Asanoa sp. WMMD1127]MDG4825644.1 exo-alpha-sialidase [Asanoa sp. WMMD1127]